MMGDVLTLVEVFVVEMKNLSGALLPQDKPPIGSNLKCHPVIIASLTLRVPLPASCSKASWEEDGKVERIHSSRHSSLQPANEDTADGGLGGSRQRQHEGGGGPVGGYHGNPF
ncbi:unnamed protein product [Boreogadus saida]